MPVAATHQDISDETAEFHRLLRDSAAAFGKKNGLSRARALRKTRPGFDRAAWAEMAASGWTGILLPETFGGQGLSFAEMGVVAEELARTLSPEPLVATSVLAASLLAASDNETLKQELLPKIASGERVIAVGFAGAIDGLSPDAAGVVANEDDGQMVLRGSVHHVYPALSADDFLIAAQGPEGFSIFRIDANTAGVSIREELRADGTYAGHVTLLDVRPGRHDLVASGDAALAAMVRACDAACIMTSAELLGVMDEALNLTLNYLRTRVQFGKPIGSFQALQHRAVDLWIQKEMSLAVVADAIRILSDANATDDDVSMAASRAKARCGDAAHTICREAIKLHGAIGFTDEYDVGLFLRRAMTLNAWLGNPADHRRRYAKLMARNGARADRGEEKVPFSAVFMSDEQADVDWNTFSDREFRAGVFAYLDKHYPRDMRHTGRRGSAVEMDAWLKRLGRKGWMAPAWPKEYGGMGLSPAKQIIFIEERERVGIMRHPDMGTVMFGPMLMRYGTEEQKAKYLPRILSNDDVWCQGYSEPNAGSDLASLQTSAVWDRDAYVLNGSKIWTTSGHWADHMFLLARTSKEGKKQEGITFFLLDMKTPGVTVRGIENLSGHTEFAQEFLENVRVPAENIVGEVNKGWTVANSLLGFERLNSGSPRYARLSLQSVEKVARATGAWGDAEFQAKYVRILLDVEDLGSAYQRFADLMSYGNSPGPELSQLKIFVAETTQRASELLMETAGGSGALQGLTRFGDEDVSLLSPFYSHFNAAIASGSNEIQRNIIAKRVLNLP